jgi:glycosyltransferase involved in cell wall biosynthesis
MVTSHMPATVVQQPSRPMGVPGPVAPRLRVAVLVRAQACRWLVDAIEHLATESWIDLTLLIVARVQPPPRTVALAPDLRLFLALERLCRRRAGLPFVPVDVLMRARAGGIALVELPDEPAVGAWLATRRFDLMLAATAFAAADTCAARAEWGCWHIGDELTDRRGAGLGLLAPLIEGDVVTPMNLCLQARDGTSVLLASSTGATQGGSFGLQREHAFRKLPSLLLRALRALVRGEIVAPCRQVGQLRFGASPGQLPPAAGIRALYVSGCNTIRWRHHLWSNRDAWFVALRRAAEPLDPARPVVGTVQCLVAPGHLYWADPFLLDADGRQFVFVEEYGLRDQRGVIACLELRADGSARRLGIAIDEAHHVSYPQVFRHDGRWYLTLESGAARRVRLYCATAFPLRWEPVADLLVDCVGVDPTLHFHDRHWYLFASVSERGSGTSDELFLFISDTLTGPYRPHPCNPVVKDVRRARPAGALFVNAGRLIRPAQDCAPAYGAAVVFNEVLELSPTRYRERPLARLDAAWMPGADGCHTYSCIQGSEALDARGEPPPGVACIPVVDDQPVVADAPSASPLVSVIMPVYNGERFLAQALDSALAQTLRSSEIIVVDDGSTDGSGALADRYAAAHPGRVRVVHQENQGLPLARNAAIAVARGRYLALLDADDIWLPGHLAACVDVLERDPAVGLVHADAEDIDARGRVLPRGRWQPRWTHGAHDPFTAILLRRQHVACLTAVFRRSVIERVGDFDARFNRLGSEDRDMWLRIAKVANLVYLSELHAQYRVHGNNMSANAEHMRRAQRALVDKHCARARGRWLRRRALAAVEAEYGHELATAEPAWPALRAFLYALAHDPFRIDAWKGLIRRILIGRRPAGPTLPP